MPCARPGRYSIERQARSGARDIEHAPNQTFPGLRKKPTQAGNLNVSRQSHAHEFFSQIHYAAGFSLAVIAFASAIVGTRCTLAVPIFTAEFVLAGWHYHYILRMPAEPGLRTIAILAYVDCPRACHLSFAAFDQEPIS